MDETRSERLTPSQRFLHAERRGLKLAILSRTAIVVFALFYLAAVTTLTEYSLRWWSIVALTALAATGIAHYRLIGTGYESWWIKYAAYALDVIAICAFFVIIPVSRADEVPQIIAFRAYGIYYLFPVIALSALSLSWRLVLWTAAIAVAGWWAAFFWIISGMERTLSWADMPAGSTRQHYEEIFLSIDFIGRGNRIEETGFLFFASCIIALVVYRARAVFFAQIKAQRAESAERAARLNVTETFGRFVPNTIADDLIRGKGNLESRETHASVLVLDIAGFTRFAEDNSLAEVIERLNAFLAMCSEAIVEQSGVVIAFTGDGLLASFNAPRETDNPAEKALAAAESLLERSADHSFVVRIGVASGTVVAGSVGSSSHMAFTIYGPAVNRAARLEALCKPEEQSLLVDADTVRLADARNRYSSLGDRQIRGVERSVEIFAKA